MTNDNKPLMSDTSTTFDAPTTEPMKFEFKFDPKDNGHTAIFAPTFSGMSYSALSMTDAEVVKVRDE